MSDVVGATVQAYSAGIVRSGNVEYVPLGLTADLC